MSRPGKAFEAEIRDFFRAAAAWSHGFDNVGAGSARCPRCSQPVARLNARRPADRVACYHGRSVLVECKETLQPRLPWAALQEHQARHLESHQDSGGVSLIVIRWRIPRASRVWALPWRDYAALRARLDRSSLPLADPKRPPELVEVPRRRLHPAAPEPVWDLSTALRRTP